MAKMLGTSKYAAKVRSGAQMYGTSSSGGKGCCAHDRVPDYVPRDRYWWGEKRPGTVVDPGIQEYFEDVGEV